MKKLSHFQMKLIMCFISVGHYFIHSRNHHLSTYKLSTSVQTQTLKAFLSLLPLPQSQRESGLDCQPGDAVMFCQLGKQVPRLCYLPKDTEILHQVGNQIPTPATRHCVPASAETGSLFHMSRQRPCPPRTYTLPEGGVHTAKGHRAALAASQQPSLPPEGPAAAWSPQLRRWSCQPASDRSVETQEQEPETLWLRGNSLQ